MSEKILELKPCPFCGKPPSILKNMGTVFCGNDACFGPQATAERLEDSAVQWNTRASSPAQEPVTTEPMSPAMTALNSEPYNRGYIDGWATAHEPAPCGHARANWKDPKFGTPEYRGEEKCEICAALAIPAPPQPGRDANDKHYLAAIRHHLKRLYSVYPNNARLREQISDEIDWIDRVLTGEPK